VIVFTMNMAAYATPALLGGSKARVMSYLIYELNANTLNWPFGSAVAIILVFLTIVIMLAYQRAIASGKRKVILK
jgi:putative spermidine/putrescine transport system permease protein